MFDLKNWTTSETGKTFTESAQQFIFGFTDPEPKSEVQGTDQADWLYASNNSAMIDAGEGDDYVFGGGGNDTLLGGYGVNGGDDTLDGGYGDDHLRGIMGNDQLYGGAGNDWLWGGDGNDTLDGGYGRDTLDGGDGDDVLRVGVGQQAVSAESSARDDLSGGGGADSFDLTGLAFGSTSDSVIIRDWQAGETVTMSLMGVEQSRLYTIVDGGTTSAVVDVHYENGTMDFVRFAGISAEQIAGQISWVA